MKKTNEIRIVYTENRFCELTCPECGHYLRFEETNCQIKSGAEAKYLAPDEMHHSFTAILTCKNAECSLPVCCCGIVDAHLPNDEPSKGEEYISLYKPQFFHPHLNLFKIPDECPTSVTDCLTASFKLFFCDPSASGLHLRITIERLLDDQKVPSTTINTLEESRSLNLHQRIKKFKKGNPELGLMLMGIKWLGNDAGHKATLVHADIVNAYDILRYIIDELYEKPFLKQQALSTAKGLTNKFASKAG